MISFDKICEQFLYDEKNPILLNNGFFLLFLSIFTVCFFLAKNNKNARVSVFCCFSLYFFYKACGYYFILIILSAIVDFMLSNALYKQSKPKIKLIFLVTSIVLNLGMLFFFKYTNFFISILNDTNLIQVNPLILILPIGISFYTFENLSYTIDVYRGHFRPITNFMDYLFLLY